MTKFDPTSINPWVDLADAFIKAGQNKPAQNSTQTSTQQKNDASKTLMIDKQFKADQLYSYIDEEGDGWLLIRLGQSPGINSIKLPTGEKQAKLLAARDMNVAITA